MNEVKLSAPMATVMSIVLFVAIGCQPRAELTDQANHSENGDHEVLPSYTEAVSQLKTHRDVVRDAFAAGKPDDCDDALHEAAHLLGHMAEIAKNAELSDDDVNAVTKAAEELFGFFEQIHEGFHDGGEGAAFDDVTDQINTAIDTLDSKDKSN